jgi:outer membrane protein assembly factor BamB
MYLESPQGMINVAVSNIVSDRVNNLLFYTSSWADSGAFVSKICRVFYPQTHHPAQECVNTYNIYSHYLGPLALNIKADLLITTVIENAPAAFNTTTFEMNWNDSESMGSDPSVDYKMDPFTGDVYWIGGDDLMYKMDSTGTRLFVNDTGEGGTRQFALDSRRQIAVRAWRNMSDPDWPLIVSAWDIERTGLRELWQWKNEDSNKTNTDCTPPVIDDQNGVTYFVNLPDAIALDTNTGHHRWQTEVVTTSEMDTSDLVSECTAFNEQTQILYVLVKSMKAPFKLFLIAVNTGTGKVLRRMDVSQTDRKITTPFCPILIGNEMIYIPWLLGAYPDMVPLTIVGIPQLS